MLHPTFSLPLLLVLLTSPSLQSPPDTWHIWPMPRVITRSHPHSSSLLSPNLTITTFPLSHQNRHLSAAARRYQALLRPRPRHVIAPTTVHVIAVHVSIPEAPLTHGANESYTISVPSGDGAAVVTAATAWGAMRALETLRQLGERARLPSGLFVSDWPLFPHRGLLLDTSRNYFPVEDVLRTIGALSANKMNVFHWHLTDSHSFPVELASEPELAEKGSYGSGMRYSGRDVKRVVEFGLDHGVRVMPEIDMPGHTGSWAEAYPEIVTCANMFWWPAGSEWSDRLAAEPGTGQLNPLNPKTYQVVKNVIDDIVSMFPEPFFHGGADEITPNCWKTDPTIQNHLKNNGTLSDLLELFVNTTLPYILSHNKTAVYWEDVLLDGEIHVNPSTLPPEHTILQTWNNGPNNTKKIVQAGYRAIVSSSEFYYLDCGHGGFVGNNSIYNQPPGTDQGNGGSWCGPFKTWQQIYNYDITYGLTEEEARLVLGGEVALWTEQADPTVLDARIWPRAAAFAEAMWSGNKGFAEATDRLNEWRYRMVERGVGAEPIQPLWCVRNPGMCNTVHEM